MVQNTGLMPPAFSDGLIKWSARADGGTERTLADLEAMVIPSDNEFGTCLEVRAAGGVQPIRAVERTLVQSGQFLRITARVRAVSGGIPSVRIAAWAGDTRGNHVADMDEYGAYGRPAEMGGVVEVTAMVGIGVRSGFDMPWTSDVRYAHFGIDVNVKAGSLYRVDDIVIEDVTALYLRELLDFVDVRDFGAVGDGQVDDHAAFVAADNAAKGKTVVVPEGIYKVSRNLTMRSPMRFTGKLDMPKAAVLSIGRNFDFPTYAAAFGDDTIGLEKALQALFRNGNHEELDLMGRQVRITRPIDVAAAVGDVTNFAQRRVLRNGALKRVGTTPWNTRVKYSYARYNANKPYELFDVGNVDKIQVGSLIEGVGVGREVYVRAVSIRDKTITLSQPLHSAPARQQYTFRRFRYMLDFSGFERISRFRISGVQFLNQGRGSGYMLPPEGIANEINECWFTSPEDRAITSIGEGCNGLSIESCQFVSSEGSKLAIQRRSIAFNTNKNDMKIRDNRALYFKHFAVMAGGGHLVSGNHFFQGDSGTAGGRTAGLIIGATNCKTSLIGNYVDNCWIEFTNEFDETPSGDSSLAFGSFAITGNIFTAHKIPSWFSFIHIRPIGTGHSLDGISITGNNFKVFGGSPINRVDRVNFSGGRIDHKKSRAIDMHSNTFFGVDQRTQSPQSVKVSSRGRLLRYWNSGPVILPFFGETLTCDGFAPMGKLEAQGGAPLPDIQTSFGKRGHYVRLDWGKEVRGEAVVRIRSDKID
ncbi:glycosyl hydrolase family 28-related protein [Paracoccaceae bacterium GXU_MW_L88]